MSKIFITLDYELYFGSNSGTYQRSMIEPTEKLLTVLDKHCVKASFFVDSGYLIKLEEFKSIHHELEEEYQAVTDQIKYLTKNGHDVQLHIHPHWEDSSYSDNGWNIDTTRYRLEQFNNDEVARIVKTYKEVLERIGGKKVFAFRAGGWCIQPFSHVKSAFIQNGIWLDSTVFLNGYNNSDTHYFDFRKAPKKDIWRFNSDPVKEEQNGQFLELPISSYRVPPLFFWRLVASRIIGGSKHHSLGDGSPAGGSKKDKIRMLTQFSNTVVSIDGYKSKLLNRAFKKSNNSGFKHFVIIGHPKALSLYSISQLDRFLEENNNEDFHTYISWVDKKEDEKR